MDLVVRLVVRTVTGLFLAWLLGAVGFLVGWMLWSPSMSTSAGSILRVCGAGIGGGLGTFAGWLQPQNSRALMIMTFGLALMGGLAGACGGYLYGVTNYEEWFISRTAYVSTILGAGVVSNAFFVLVNAYWLLRRRNV